MILTATASPVCKCIIHLISGLAWWMAECNIKPALFIPRDVDPCSNTSPSKSIVSSEDAVTSEYNNPNGWITKCSSMSFILAWIKNQNVEHTPENKIQMMFNIPQTSNSHPKTKPQWCLMSLKRRTHTWKQIHNDVQYPSNVEHTPENKSPMMFNIPQT